MSTALQAAFAKAANTTEKDNHLFSKVVEKCLTIERIPDSLLDKWQEEMDKINVSSCFSLITSLHTTVKRAIRLPKSYLDSFYAEGTRGVGIDKLRKRMVK